MWSRPAIVVALGAGILLSIAGCGGPERALAPEEVVELDELPPGVLDAATKALPGVKFEVAWKENEPVDGQAAYEIRGRTDKGKIRDVKVLESGEVVEVD